MTNVAAGLERRPPVAGPYRLVTGVAAAAAAAAAFARLGATGPATVAALLAAVLVVLSAVDLRRRVIPNRIVLPAAGLVFLGQVAVAPDRTLEWAGAGLAAGLLFLLAALAYPPGLGMGDVKLALLLGLGLGRDVVDGLLVGLLAAALLGAVLLLRDGRQARKTALPFAPFLSAGALAVLLI